MNELKDIAFLASKAAKTTDLRKVQRLLKSIELMVRSAQVTVKVRLAETKKDDSREE